LRDVRKRLAEQALRLREREKLARILGREDPAQLTYTLQELSELLQTQTNTNFLMGLSPLDAPNDPDAEDYGLPAIQFYMYCYTVEQLVRLYDTLQHLIENIEEPRVRELIYLLKREMLRPGERNQGDGLLLLRYAFRGQDEEWEDGPIDQTNSGLEDDDELVRGGDLTPIKAPPPQSIREDKGPRFLRLLVLLGSGRWDFPTGMPQKLKMEQGVHRDYGNISNLKRYLFDKVEKLRTSRVITSDPLRNQFLRHLWPARRFSRAWHLTRLNPLFAQMYLNLCKVFHNALKHHHLGTDTSITVDGDDSRHPLNRGAIYQGQAECPEGEEPVYFRQVKDKKGNVTYKPVKRGHAVLSSGYLDPSVSKMECQPTINVKQDVSLMQVKGPWHEGPPHAFTDRNQ
jgi:hypothetical protein